MRKEYFSNLPEYDDGDADVDVPGADEDKG
jgi:hypothetical protein